MQLNLFYLTPLRQLRANCNGRSCLNIIMQKSSIKNQLMLDIIFNFMQIQGLENMYTSYPEGKASGKNRKCLLECSYLCYRAESLWRFEDYSWNISTIESLIITMYMCLCVCVCVWLNCNFMRYFSQDLHRCIGVCSFVYIVFICICWSPY